MKKITLIVLALGVLACDPEECAREIISNSSSNDIYVYRISSDSSFSDSFFIESNSSVNVGIIECSTGQIVVNYSAYDSVTIESENGSILKTYYPSDSEKSIYNMKYWNIRSISENEKEYVFTITDEDLN